MFKYLYNIFSELKYSAEIPENILICENEESIKICDFGWSSFIDDKKWLMKKAGTYAYMAPETLEN